MSRHVSSAGALHIEVAHWSASRSCLQLNAERAIHASVSADPTCRIVPLLFFCTSIVQGVDSMVLASGLRIIDAAGLPFCGAAGAGFPSPSQDYEEARIDLVKLLSPDRPSVYVMRVSGWSVRDAGIYDADLIVVDRALKPKNGSFVIAMHDGGFVIRQLCLTGGPPRLEHRNSAIRSAPIELDETVEFWGVVEAIARKLS